MKIGITTHAIEMYLKRRERDFKAKRDLTKEDWHRLNEEIRLCVETGFKERYVFTIRPKGFRLYRQSRKTLHLPEGQRFVCCSRPEDANFGFIVKQESQDTWVVVTTLTRTTSKGGSPFPPSP